MKISAIGFVSLFSVAQCFAMTPQAKSKAPTLKANTNFSSALDFTSSVSSSNLKLKNKGTHSKTVYGLYVRQFSYVTPGQSCSSAVPMYSSSQNTNAGAMVMPVTIDANADVTIGANYLYNMIYNAIYYIQIIVPSSPPGCALPGCTWGSDTTIYNWCIYLGAMAPVSATSNYTSKVAPATTSVSASEYNYDLISNYVYLGPISCDDRALTCSVSTSQTQSF